MYGMMFTFCIMLSGAPLSHAFTIAQSRNRRSVYLTPSGQPEYSNGRGGSQDSATANFACIAGADEVHALEHIDLEISVDHRAHGSLRFREVYSVNLIAGPDQPSSGAIIVDGQALSGMRESVGLVCDFTLGLSSTLISFPC